MAETTGQIYFGGKGYQALPWNPMLYMEEYLAELAFGAVPRAPTYVRPVKAALARFATFTASTEVVHPAEITRTHLLRFQAHLAVAESERGVRLGLAYQRQLLIYLRGWLNWLTNGGYLTVNPWTDINLGRISKPPQPLDEDEIADLFAAHRNQAFSIPPFAFHRREVILVLLYGCGLRLHELEALNMAQMLGTADAVTIPGLGTRRTMPYGQFVKDVVHRWLRHRSATAEFGEDALLISASGARLSAGRIHDIVAQCGARACAEVSPRRLRDSFGATLLDGDVSIDVIMKLMGHTRRDQTQAYVRVVDPALKVPMDAVMLPKLERLLHVQ